MVSARFASLTGEEKVSAIFLLPCKRSAAGEVAAQPTEGASAGGLIRRTLSGGAFVYPATGAHITCSTLSAPVASIASRSNPSAEPDASGMIASAARKSSSTG